MGHPLLTGDFSVPGYQVTGSESGPRSEMFFGHSYWYLRFYPDIKCKCAQWEWYREAWGVTGVE